jgi:putative tricarboxylic transport membrane protein
VSCIAPANPGGGWDLTCRAAAEAFALVDSTIPLLSVVNMPGEGGAVAFAAATERMQGNENVIVAASPSTLLGLAQSHYGEHVETDVRWLAALGSEPSVVAVASDAPWRTLEALIEHWRRYPDSVKVGGGSVHGGQDHIKTLLLARAAGIDLQRVRYEALSGPPEAIEALRSGAITVFPGDASEVIRQVARKELRVLAVLGAQRMVGAMADVPTAREQGYDVAWDVWRGFYAPPGIGDEAYEAWVSRLEALSESTEWKATLERNAMTPYFISGAEFEAFVVEQTAAYRSVSKAIGVIP